jgi:hypothetical protein
MQKLNGEQRKNSVQDIFCNLEKRLPKLISQVKIEKKTISDILNEQQSFIN